MPQCDQIATISGDLEFICNHFVGDSFTICKLTGCPHYERHLHDSKQPYIKPGAWMKTKDGRWHISDCCPLYEAVKVPEPEPRKLRLIELDDE